MTFDAHDHAACAARARAAAAARAAEGARLTPVRARVLDILVREHRAMGAYDILDVLRAEGRPAQPPVAYRALDFLVAQGLAHRVERLNAYVACARPEAPHAPAFLICRGCEAAAETPALPLDEMLAEAAPGFAVERATVEAEGLCPACAAKP